ncbi:ABC transporter G family member 20 [Scaptodrosophila lebanonensis]|uniref:ABC transporter G family member 20 n=1 Tax=Drosophila lebanonensis TaxID=7225 RepID=A0A6J2TL72_DROLE|nr:ABC transporter G family member 20 [Scaptodrosophila lebanonensis]XP_030375747.1 ABC transporter G family member 20 [Scaptodrosophila lebanonensis]XP_030375748.1 ABC transporter G family member 20 [Scaptodrosophila lebanonensis]
MDAEADGLPPAPPQASGMDLAARRRLFISQPSTLATRRQQAVCVRRAHKMYGGGKNPNIVLDGLNMTVPKGAIYGLLGASGCGKTTLLSCIVGRRRLNSGEIWVLGGRPGSRGSGVPGPRIGYMPQEVALYGEFTMRETLIYFGLIAHMSRSDIEDRTEFLLKLLNMPNGSKFVKNLSGGQQRRMSLAVALLHEPELLILDEPTVGVDPVLRQSIWDHLVKITNDSHTTVIITTHYIEECAQAHVIGLLRGGKMLAEESPHFLRQQYNADSLEDVFLKLSVMQNMGKRRRSSIAQEIVEQVTVPAISNPALDISDEQHAAEISGEFGDNISMSSAARDPITTTAPAAPPLPPADETPTSFWYNLQVMQKHHLHALIWKNFLWMMRNVGIMLFIVGLPVVQILLFCYAIGHDPTGLKIAVSNHEMSKEMVEEQFCPVARGCHQSMLSCRYIDMLVRNKSMVVNYMADDEAAYDEVRRGRAWAALVFQPNYTSALVERTEMGRYAENDTIEESDLGIRMDWTNQQISTLMYRDLQYTFLDFVQVILAECDVNPKIGTVPTDFKEPIYGYRNPNFTDFAAPGVILTIIFFLSVAITSGAMLIERNEGMLERCLVAGITGTEILLSQVVTQFTVMFSQTSFVLIVSFYFFELTLVGNVWLVVALCILNGLCGMCFGFVISCAVDTERTATYVAMGSFLPIVMLCGIIWPIEGMYPLLQSITLFLPLTKPTESLRSILQRGWDMSYPTVYYGFISISAWVVVFLVLTILLIKFKKG